MAEQNSMLKLLKDGKLSEKPYAGAKSDIFLARLLIQMIRQR